jgi:uncharacterized RDD family membrane protein YckC
MKSIVQLVPAPLYPAHKVVVHHNQKEDFTLYKNAGFVARWYALAIDLMLFAPFCILIRLPFETTIEYLGAFGHDAKYLGLSLLLILVPYLIYFILPTTFFGRTLGKKVVGLRVVRVNCSEHLEFGQVVLRETLGKLLSTVLLLGGFFMVGLNSRKRALHDYLGNTVVVTYRER